MPVRGRFLAAAVASVVGSRHKLVPNSIMLNRLLTRLFPALKNREELYKSVEAITRKIFEASPLDDDDLSWVDKYWTPQIGEPIAMLSAKDPKESAECRRLARQVYFWALLLNIMSHIGLSASMRLRYMLYRLSPNPPSGCG